MTNLSALTLITLSNFSALASVTLSADIEIPAFAKNTSNRPYSATARSTTAFTSASSPASTLHGCTSTPGYREASSRLCVSRCVVSRSAMKMARAPLRANWWAAARPMPRGELAPVMMMTLSLTLL